jgi:hypothetical protein
MRTESTNIPAIAGWLVVVLVLLGGQRVQGQEVTANGLAAAQAALGNAFTYQGRLHQAGVPADGLFEMRFTLFDALQGGSQVGNEVTVNQVSVSSGNFTVSLSFGANVFGGQQRFLEVAVRPADSTGNFTILAPRQELTPAPYALFSAGAPWGGVTNVPTGFADGVDNDTLSGLNCATDQVALWSGSVWVCSDQVKNLEARVAALENLLQHFSRNGNDITISGANLRVVNGTGSTDGTPNGLGNVIIGYNEGRTGSQIVNLRTGSHMLVVGKEHNYSSFGGIVVGYHNDTRGNYASVSGGSFNIASGLGSSVSGGLSNVASGLSSSVSGGSNNTASGSDASVSGGNSNTASGPWASVSGGNGNTAIGSNSSVSGGILRTAVDQGDWRAGSLFEDN